MRRFFTEKENSLFQNAGERFNNFIENIKEEIDGGSERASGWSLKEIKYFYLNLAKYQPLRGGT